MLLKTKLKTLGSILLGHFSTSPRQEAAVGAFESTRPPRGSITVHFVGTSGVISKPLELFTQAFLSPPQRVGFMINICPCDGGFIFTVIKECLFGAGKGEAQLIKTELF
jgi:hypothetical protein